MRKYSDFFQTLHDEEGPTGYLGRGTHYSVLRATVFHDATGRRSRGQFADFAVIWDEDHDVRVIEPIERVYRRGLLPCFLMFGERKGTFTALTGKSPANTSSALELQEKLNWLTCDLDGGDSWPACVASVDDSENSIIDDNVDRIALYLNNLIMLWELGTKAPATKLPFDPILLKKVDTLELGVRAANCFKNDGIVYVGDLVKKTEQEMMRMPNFGRSSVQEVQGLLASMGLHLGMDVPSWPPENIEMFIRRFEYLSGSRID
jgi:hypothetical protein